jgi:glutamate-1-semialdehyde 2,1-aminomutase
MEQLAPIGPVYQAGTLSGNPLATAAGLAVLDLLDDAAYKMLAGRAAELGPMLRNVLHEVTPVQVPVVGPLVGLFFSESPVTNYVESKAAADTGWYPRFFRSMLERGVAFAPGAYEAMFPSLAHTWDDIERTVDLARAAIAVA